ncbi:MAG TPA: divalent-cation tolerance protein CutA [Paucimonas sp.]|nr:divalent-cation tolerance protein CutA [Paucimonas sp.]HJW55699.1 divalent-cation tolerance protein CutA [Burkholderiaceae bacterium]
MSQALLVLTNLPDASTAQKLARQLVEQKLAACVNILPAVQSVYRWQGAVEEAVEVTLFIKTMQACYMELQSTILSAHPYQTPEIIAVAIDQGLPAYLDWMAQETKRDIHV